MEGYSNMVGDLHNNQTPDKDEIRCRNSEEFGML